MDPQLRIGLPLALGLFLPVFMLGLAGDARSQGWTVSDFSMYQNKNLTLAVDVNNMVLGRKYYFKNKACTVAAPGVNCTSLTNFSATAKLKKSKVGSETTSTIMQNAVVTWGCDCKWTYSDDPILDGGNWFELDECLAPGKYEFYRTYSWYPAGSVHSEGTQTNHVVVSLTVPDVVDLAVTNFDVLNEATLCEDGNFTARMKVKNYGELDAWSVVIELWMASNSAMTTDLELVGSYTYGFLAGGDVDNEIELEYPLPSYSGKKYFAAKIRDNFTPDTPSCGPYDADGTLCGCSNGEWGPNRSNSDAVKQYVDVDFKSQAFVTPGFDWVIPEILPTKMCYDETYRFKFTYHNKGELPSLPTTAVEVQIRSADVGWTTLETIPIGSIECNSEPITAPPPGAEKDYYEFKLASDLMVVEDEDDIGKVRKLRLHFVNAGEQLQEKNDNSWAKKVRVAPVPKLSAGSPGIPGGGIRARALGQWIPTGRPWNSNPGAPGNYVDIEGEDESGGPLRRLKFELAAISKEPGVCMNFGSSLYPDEYLGLDLRFLKTASINTEFDEPELLELDDGTTDPNGLQIEATEKASLKVVRITSYDYGAHAQLRVIALDEADEPVGDPSEWLRLPIDESGPPDPANPGEVIPQPNDIADAAAGYDMSPATGDYSSLFDDELEYSGAGAPGDGLTRYEEYRGFMVAPNQYVRTSPDHRDVFVHLEGWSADLGGFDHVLGGGVWRVTPEQLNGSAGHLLNIDPGTTNTAVSARIINFNRCTHLSHTTNFQHGIWLKVFNAASPSMPPGLSIWWGEALFPDGQSPAQMQVDYEPHPPWGHGRIEVYADRIADNAAEGTAASTPYWSATSAVVQAIKTDTVAHELFHSLSIKHHKDFPGPGPLGEQLYVYDYIRDFSWPQSLYTGWDEYPTEMGVLACAMRGYYLHCFAAVVGDSNVNGVPLQAGESKDPYWPTVPLADVMDPLCTSDPSQTLSPLGGQIDNCLSQIVIDELQGP